MQGAFNNYITLNLFRPTPPQRTEVAIFQIEYIIKREKNTKHKKQVQKVVTMMSWTLDKYPPPPYFASRKIGRTTPPPRVA